MTESVAAEQAASRRVAPVAAEWAPAPTAPELDPGAVHVWRVDLSRPEVRMASLRRLLAPAEREREAAFRFQRDRDRFAAARGTLRLVLGQYLRADPASLALATAAYGKPYLSAPAAADLQFNLSHDDDLALIAVARGRPVGVDLERVRPDVPMLAIAEQFFAPDEVETLRRLPAERRPAAFFAGWTRKEAFVKARGDGLSLRLDRFAVSLAPGERPALLRVDGDDDEPRRWTLLELPPVPGYAAALATTTGVSRLACWDASP